MDFPFPSANRDILLSSDLPGCLQTNCIHFYLYFPCIMYCVFVTVAFPTAFKFSYLSLDFRKFIMMLWFFVFLCVCAYFTWDSLSFLDLWIYNSLNLEKCCHCFFKFFSQSPLTTPPPASRTPITPSQTTWHYPTVHQGFFPPPFPLPLSLFLPPFPPSILPSFFYFYFIQNLSGEFLLLSLQVHGLFSLQWIICCYSHPVGSISFIFSF